MNFARGLSCTMLHCAVCQCQAGKLHSVGTDNSRARRHEQCVEYQSSGLNQGRRGAGAVQRLAAQLDAYGAVSDTQAPAA